MVRNQLPAQVVNTFIIISFSTRAKIFSLSHAWRVYNSYNYESRMWSMLHVDTWHRSCTTISRTRVKIWGGVIKYAVGYLILIVDSNDLKFKVALSLSLSLSLSLVSFDQLKDRCLFTHCCLGRNKRFQLESDLFLFFSFFFFLNWSRN